MVNQGSSSARDQHTHIRTSAQVNDYRSSKLVPQPRARCVPDRRVKRGAQRFAQGQPEIAADLQCPRQRWHDKPVPKLIVLPGHIRGTRHRYLSRDDESYRDRSRRSRPVWHPSSQAATTQDLLDSAYRPTGTQLMLWRCRTCRSRTRSPRSVSSGPTPHTIESARRTPTAHQ